MSPRIRHLLVLTACFATIAVWLHSNPRGQLGWCCYAYSTYNSIPCPVSDFQVRADGKSRKIEKTHNLVLEDIRWLLTPFPDVLIIATGWDGVTKVSTEIRTLKNCEVHILKSNEARALYNHSRDADQQVAIHFHSTC